MPHLPCGQNDGRNHWMGKLKCFVLLSLSHMTCTLFSCQWAQRKDERPYIFSSWLQDQKHILITHVSFQEVSRREKHTARTCNSDSVFKQDLHCQPEARIRFNSKQTQQQVFLSEECLKQRHQTPAGMQGLMLNRMDNCKLGEFCTSFVVAEDLHAALGREKRLVYEGTTHASIRKFKFKFMKTKVPHESQQTKRETH